MRSWNNDLFYFDTKTSKYFKIKDVGSRPSPRAAFGYAQTANVGFIFGGRCASGVQTLDDKTIFIVSILRPGHGHL